VLGGYVNLGVVSPRNSLAILVRMETLDSGSHCSIYQSKTVLNSGSHCSIYQSKTVLICIS